MSIIPPPPPGFTLDSDKRKPPVKRTPAPRPAAPSPAKRFDPLAGTRPADIQSNWQTLRTNIVPSAGNALAGFWGMVRHPADTMGSMSDAGLGAVNKGLKAVFGRGLKPLRGETQQQANERAGYHDMAANAVVDFYKNRYGSFAQAKKTVLTDPVGALLDATAVAGGGASAARLGKAAVRRGAPVVSRVLPRRAPAAADVAEPGIAARRMPAPAVPDEAIAALPDGFTLDDHAAPDVPVQTKPIAPEGSALDAPAPRQVDRIDISQIPPPPPGFKLDAPEQAGPDFPVGSMAMDAEGGPSLSAPAAPPAGRVQPLDQPLAPSQVAAAANDVTPGDVLPVPSNMVGSAEEAAAIDKGRFVPETLPDPRGGLTTRTVRTWGGAEIPKVGPIDLVGWLRLRGGLADQGGELSHIGLTNAPRRGMDFLGQEARFGPLVNENGMRLDDAAMSAWEAGYFPDLPERPSVNQFLDALRDTHEGRDRRFHPDDFEEIDRFNAAQDQRYSIQQQRFETGEPVWRDKSYPAEEPPPFAPVSAYEEWGPSGGPDFAGNINLGKLESPQDIKRALDFTNRRIGFDGATRGRIAQAETERLAGELGMTPETLLSRRKGQALNAEEALAARQILAKSSNELVNMAKRVRAAGDEPGSELLAKFREAWVRHAAIQEQVAGATAEAGRALAQFKMMANSRAVRGDVLEAMVQGGGGSGRLTDAANVLLDAVEAGPGTFNAIAEKAIKPRFRDKLTELWINSLLSGPQTHAVNIVSNTLTAMAQIPEHAAASVIGKGRQMMSRTAIDRVVGSEVGARAFGLLQGVKEGSKFFADSLISGEPIDFVSKVESQSFKAISGVKGEIIRAPTRLLTAEDEFFKGVARRMELNAEAVRIAHKEGLKGEAAKRRIAGLVANPTDDMLARSMDYARYLTFQRKLGPGAGKIASLSNDFPVLKLFIPFVRTPTNLLKFAVERSPAAPLLKEWRADFMAGGARRDVAIARSMLGTGFGMAIYHYAQQGLITGSAPSDPAKARLQYADGWQPYSIRVGDKWYSYKRLDPLSTTMGVAADLANLPKGMSEKQKQDKATLLVAAIMGNLADKTWLSGLSDVVGALNEPDRNADRLVQRLVGSIVVPTGVAQIARTVDPVQREAKTVPDYIQSRIPFASKSLLPRRDVWGNEIVNEGGLGPDIISPIWTSTVKNDPVNKALLDAEIGVGIPRDVVNKRKLTPQEYDRYKAEAGKAAHDALGPLVTGPGWQGLSPDDQESIAKKAISAARKDVRENLFGGADSANDPPPPPPPAGFSVEGEAGGVNVYADLKRAIPGIGIQSGYRTPEYQDDMRRRGYRPAANSRHLDGSSLDLTPPPGKSMAWLKAEVARLHPDAQLLDEGDHLHATFSGYFGAPALGGARSAGLKNPLQGMPPPPPGFTIDGGR